MQFTRFELHERIICGEEKNFHSCINMALMSGGRGLSTDITSESQSEDS